MVYLRKKSHLFKIRDFVAFSGPKICSRKVPLFEKLQHSEDFTKSALIAIFHSRLAISSKQNKTSLCPV
jgi:hypothetical protein